MVTNQTSSQSNLLKDLPNAQGAFVLGIVSICIGTLCCCFDGSFLGVVLSVIGFILGKKAMKVYEAEPGNFNEKSYRRAKTGVTLSIVGFVVSMIASCIYLFFWYLAITQQLPPELQEQVNKSLEVYGL